MQRTIGLKSTSSSCCYRLIHHFGSSLQNNKSVVSFIHVALQVVCEIKLMVCLTLLHCFFEYFHSHLPKLIYWIVSSIKVINRRFMKQTLSSNLRAQETWMKCRLSVIAGSSDPQVSVCDYQPCKLRIKVLCAQLQAYGKQVIWHWLSLQAHP